MAKQGSARRLAAILSADVVAYSRLVAADDVGTLRRVGRQLAEIGRCLQEHGVEEADGVADDAVNIAARLQGLADPGGVCVSKTVVEQASRSDLDLDFLGERRLKNIQDRVAAYRIRLEGSPRVRSPLRDQSADPPRRLRPTEPPAGGRARRARPAR